MTPVPDHYRTLQVDPEAEPEVIRAAYLCLAKKYHPDAGVATGERMVALNEAWATLGEAGTRATYDRSRSAPAGSSAARPAWTYSAKSLGRNQTLRPTPLRRSNRMDRRRDAVDTRGVLTYPHAMRSCER